MGRHLWTKLALSYLAIALISVSLVAILLNYTLSRQFRGYVEENQKLKDEQIIILLSSIYEKEGSWNPQRLQDLMNLGMMSGKEITLLDSEGEKVVDCWDSMQEMGPSSQRRMNMMGMMCGWGWSKTPPSPNVKVIQGNMKGRRIPVLVENRQVGTAVIKSEADQGIFSSQDQLFQATMNRWLWIAALGAGSFALLISFGIAHHLSYPIKALTRAVQSLRNGDLTKRVKTNGKDEIAQLANAFNHLSESLEIQEKYRKRLTGNLAHELRTPLANLQTHIEGLIDGVLPLTLENLKSMHEEILRLIRLVSNLEELNRAEASRLTLKREKTDLKAIVERTLSQFHHQFLVKGIDLKVHLPQHSIEAFFDTDKISQVLHNLLSNALKFTPRGGIVEVRAKKR